MAAICAKLSAIAPACHCRKRRMARVSPPSMSGRKRSIWAITRHRMSRARTQTAPSANANGVRPAKGQGGCAGKSGHDPIAVVEKLPDELAVQMDIVRKNQKWDCAEYRKPQRRKREHHGCKRDRLGKHKQKENSRLAAWDCIL